MVDAVRLVAKSHRLAWAGLVEDSPAEVEDDVHQEPEIDCTG